MSNFDPLGAPEDITQITKYFSLFLPCPGNMLWQLLRFDLKTFTFFTPPYCPAETPKPIKMKFYTIDYVGELTRCAKNGLNRLAGGGPHR